MSFTSTKWSSDKGYALSILFMFMFMGNMAGQVLQPQRFELPLTAHEKHFEIVPAGEVGLYMHRLVLVGKETQIHLIRLDTAFNVAWEGYLPVEKNYVVVGKKAYASKLFMLLRYRDYSRNNFILLMVDKDAAEYVRYEIRGFIPFAPTEFAVTENSVLIGGYYNKVPLVLHFSREKMQSKVLPSMFNEAGELTQIKTYPDGTFDVLISALNYMKQRTIFIKNYDADGNLIRNLALEPEGNKHLIFGRSVKTDNDVQIVAGVYGTRSTEFSRGVFIASVDAAGLQKVRYYNFADLENFFKYMKAKREQRVKSRIERRKIKGKKIRFNYRFLVHELVPYKDQYVLLGEAFYPKYINIDRGYYSGFFTRTVPTGSVIQNGRIFDGYYYTHAIVMGFKSNGDLVWDNSFEINDVRTFTLEQFVKLEVQDDKIALLYLFENKLRTKIIQNNDVVEGKSLDPIRTNSGEETVRKNDESTNKLDYWYRRYLYAYGVQELENKTKNYKRRVFYINKIRHPDTPEPQGK
jgi:hypothetical protein